MEGRQVTGETKRREIPQPYRPELQQVDGSLGKRTGRKSRPAPFGRTVVVNGGEMMGRGEWRDAVWNGGVGHWQDDPWDGQIGSCELALTQLYGAHLSRLHDGEQIRRSLSWGYRSSREAS